VDVRRVGVCMLCACDGRLQIFVYYESIKREPKIRDLICSEERVCGFFSSEF
jgi:hypothetical protein